MNDDTSPLEPDELDELLSADLDGELEAAARDLGLSPDEVAARLRATPGVDMRRLALATARDLLAEPPEMDELVAARLRAKAVRAAVEVSTTRDDDRKRRRQRMMLAAGGIAAAVVAVVAIGAGLSNQRRGTVAASAKPAAAPSLKSGASAVLGTPPGARSGAPGLGKFTNLQTLARAAVARADLPARPTANRGALTSPASTEKQLGYDAASTTVAPTAPGSGSASRAVAPASTDQSLAKSANNAENNFSIADAGQRCASSAKVPTGDAPVLRSTAILSGKPVIVLVFAGNAEHTVVVEDTNCKLLNVQMLG